VRKVGVEEELLLVDPRTGELANAAGAVLHEHRTERGDAPSPSPSRDLEGELLRHMVETHSEPSADLAEVGRQLREARRTAIAAAEDSGIAVAVSGRTFTGRASGSYWYSASKMCGVIVRE